MTEPAASPAAGFRIRRFDAVASTNDIARQMLRQGAPHGSVAHALSQTGGRGRDGRSWESPPGNLYASLALRPPGRPGDVALLGFVTALAVAEAVDGFAKTVGPAALKWPNDVLLDGRKVAGILLESDGATADGVDGLVVGVGINVDSVPAVARLPATSLRQAGSTATVDQVLGAFLEHFSAYYAIWLAQGFAPIRLTWLARAHGIGSPIAARLPQRTIEGICAGIDESGALLVDRGAERLRVHAGDVFFPGDAC